MNIKIGVYYGTFYDTELLQSSIESIKKVAGVTVVVHQRKSFTGLAESQTAQGDLLRSGADKIIYFDSKGKDKSAMMEKMNIGLEYLKSKGCTHIVQMSPDEKLNADGLLSDVIEMEKDNIDTMYYPIKAYYYDEQHYFIDTYYSAKIYRIDERVFSLNKSSVLCDPFAKMQEKTYRISKNYLHHYTFIKERYSNKLDKSIRTIDNYTAKEQMLQIHKRLQQWKKGDKALVFQNDMSRNGKVVLSEIELSVKPKIKIAVCIPIYKRYEVTEYTLNRINEIKNNISSIIELVVIIAGSEGEKSKSLADKFNFEYIETDNFPLNEKHNLLYEKAKEFNPDACIKTDSDTLLTKELFYWYYKLINDCVDYAGVIDINFQLKNKLCYFSGMNGVRSGEPHGVGRFLSKNILDKMNWRPFGDRSCNYGFDAILTSNIAKINPYTKTVYLHEIGANIVEIKTNENLTCINDFTFDKIERERTELGKLNKLLLDTNVKVKEDKFSVIIPTMWADSKTTVEMLSKLNECHFVKEIILIDNNPNERPILKQSKLKILTTGKNIFVNPAWNWGVSKSTAEKLIILNDDVSVENVTRYFKFINSNLKRKMIIGLAEFGKGKLSLSLKSVKLRPNGFGTCMALYKKDYVKIPDRFKIWVGDDIQFYNNNAYVVYGINAETAMSVTMKKINCREVAKKEYIDFIENCDVKGNCQDISCSKKSMNHYLSIGLIYSGRVPLLLNDWMNKLIEDTKDFSIKPQLIVVNNSDSQLSLKEYESNFSEIIILEGYKNATWENNTERLLKTSSLLIKCYNDIMEHCKGDLVHFREDDIIPDHNAFDLLYQQILQGKPIISGLYANRTLYTSFFRKKDKCNKLQEVEPIEVEFCPTGFVLFEREKAPTFEKNDKIRPHDWAWTERWRKEQGQQVFTHPNATCRHYINEETYVFPTLVITPENNYTKVKPKMTSNKRYVW